MASQAKDRDAKAAFVECARQWQELARQKKELGRDQSAALLKGAHYRRVDQTISGC
jgi:hypothetical protein